MKAEAPGGLMFEGDPELAELLIVFLEQAHGRLGQIAALLSRLDAVPADQPALKQLSHHFHGLAGSGSAFGFPEVSQLGRSGDQACLLRLQTGTAPDAADMATWRQLLQGLLAALPAARSYSAA